MNNKVNFKRLLSVFGIIVAIVGLSAFFYYYEKMYLDEIICIGFLDIIFICLFLFEIEFGRMHNEFFDNVSNSYAKLFLGILISCILTGLMVFLPAYAKPILIISIIVSAVSNKFVGIIASIYIGLLLLYSTGADFYEILGAFILTIAGAVLSQLIYNRKMKVFVYTLLVLISTMIPVIFYFLAYKEYKISIIIYGFICGIISSGVLFLCSKFIRPESEDEIRNKLLDILDDNYSEVIGLKSYSQSEYEHAKLVSELAYNCARKTGLDENLCASAGFYYRLGQWQGQPYVENGIKRAFQLCFPDKLIRILSEYYGEENKPSTPESALVHIVDALVIKMDVLKNQVGKSQWNTELIVYQTLNEFSSSGIYDNSGLSMNHFLIIRDFLAKENKL